MRHDTDIYDFSLNNDVRIARCHYTNYPHTTHARWINTPGNTITSNGRKNPLIRTTTAILVLL